MAAGPQFIEAAFQYCVVVVFGGWIIRIVSQHGDKLDKLNETLLTMVQQFAPRSETNERMNQIETKTNDNTGKISVLEEWRKHVDYQLDHSHQYNHIDRPPP